MDMFPVLADGHLWNFCTFLCVKNLHPKEYVGCEWMSLLSSNVMVYIIQNIKVKKTCPVWVDNFDYHIFSMSKGSLKKFDKCVNVCGFQTKQVAKNMHNWVLNSDSLYNLKLIIQLLYIA